MDHDFNFWNTSLGQSIHGCSLPDTPSTPITWSVLVPVAKSIHLGSIVSYDAAMRVGLHFPALPEVSEGEIEPQYFVFALIARVSIPTYCITAG